MKRKEWYASEKTNSCLRPALVNMEVNSMCCYAIRDRKAADRIKRRINILLPAIPSLLQWQ